MKNDMSAIVRATNQTSAMISLKGFNNVMELGDDDLTGLAKGVFIVEIDEDDVRWDSLIIVGKRIQPKSI